MQEAVFYDTLRQALWIAVIVSTPILIVALVAGLIVGLFQALTSIQEMTLTFVPKIAAIFLTLALSIPFIFSTLTRLSNQVFDLIQNGGI